mmetsp:Transcript_43245/g.105832  ORF Transcript_43245/g.105832 Transcript_43245/m.105832 type:complete len:303 (-) Transcript_43245:33-941(-)
MPFFSFLSSSKLDDIPGIVFEPAQPTIRQTAEQWRMKLPPETYKACFEHQDETIWGGRLGPGDWYGCAACASPLFTTKAYNPEGGTGWPTFNEHMEGTIRYVRDKEVGQTARTVKGKSRVEIRCKACEAYLGHVQYNGPHQTWPYSYAVNSTAVKGYSGPVPAIKRASTPPRRTSADLPSKGSRIGSEIRRSSAEVLRRAATMPSPQVSSQQALITPSPSIQPRTPLSTPQSPYSGSQPGASPASMRSPGMGGVSPMGVHSPMGRPSPMLGTTAYPGAQWGQQVPGMLQSHGSAPTRSRSSH